MVAEVETQEKVGVGLEAFWKALSKELRFVTPKVFPNLVKDVELIQGDGGLGTLLLFKFFSDEPTTSYQKERIAELDESLHQIGLEVIEGGHLNLGFSFYQTTFQLTAIGEQETLVNIKVSYESEVEEGALPSNTMASTLSFIKSLENYLLNGAS